METDILTALVIYRGIHTSYNWTNGIQYRLNIHVRWTHPEIWGNQEKMAIINILVVCTTLLHSVLSIQNVTEHTSTNHNGRQSSTEHASTNHKDWPHHNSTRYYQTDHTNTVKTKQTRNTLMSEEVKVTHTEVTTTTMTNTTQSTSSVLMKDEDMALTVLYRFLLFFVPLVLLTFIAFLYTTIRRRWKMNKPLLDMM